jgi:hypothetical protein
MAKIKKISEAFSIQPCEKHVSTEWELSHHIPHIKSIEERFAKNGECRVYVGYNFKGEEVFQWVASACNVEYFDNEFLKPN